LEHQNSGPLGAQRHATPSEADQQQRDPPHHILTISSKRTAEELSRGLSKVDSTDWSVNPARMGSLRAVRNR
jgi:hypothetical protein